MQLLPSAFVHPNIDISIPKIVEHFKSSQHEVMQPLRNPHLETPVSEAIKASATASAVLILFVFDADQLKVIVTKRSASIRFGGHICFPGGKMDGSDESPETTALREAQEEIGLDPTRVQVLGRLGEYFTQTAYRITPVVGFVDTPFSLTQDLAASPGEVESIHVIPAQLLFTSSAYALHRFDNAPTYSRGHYSLSHQNIRVSGPTVSIMMGLYESLLQSQGLLTHE